VFAHVCEESATLVLAGQHLVDFVDFNFTEVIFFRKVKCRPVVIVLEYVFDRKRGISSKTTEENDEEAEVPGVKMSGASIRYIGGWW
jgi:hypothetical protein